MCKHEIEAEAPGDETAGIDLGISNFAAISYSTGDHELYPGNALKTDERYFAKEIAKCNSSRSNKALRLRRKRSERRSHYLHAVTRHMATIMTIVGIGWGRATRPVTVREAVTRDTGNSEIVPGAITAEGMEGKPAAPIGEKEPEEAVDAGNLFNPRAIIKYISMWIIGPSVSTILTYGFFILLPGVA